MQTACSLMMGGGGKRGGAVREEKAGRWVRGWDGGGILTTATAHTNKTTPPTATATATPTTMYGAAVIKIMC